MGIIRRKHSKTVCGGIQEEEREETPAPRERERERGYTSVVVVCRLKSFVRLLISNCHPSLAPPLVSSTRLRIRLFFFPFFLSFFLF